MMSTNYMARCTKESCCPLDETAHGPVQPGLTCLQGWGTLLACHCDAEGHSGPSAADLQKENEDTISVLPGISYLGVLSKGCLLRMFWMVAHKVTLFGWLTVPVHIYSAGFPTI
ncbi:uncharacterized protein LOC100538679 isoform X3 [Meleagris gallopavo]|uniref:uncharacterized protein LOC100538679 isoform X3 n=1 Tax=Meleagris gallopavo TaxID=9103 RepID=UPI0012AC18C9|nr:uncharacterized protein LOC100538679 isoform X3 [Meleagris gallopavo]